MGARDGCKVAPTVDLSPTPTLLHHGAQREGYSSRASAHKHIDPVTTSIKKASLQPQLRRFITRLWRPGCCFRSDNANRFSHAKFSLSFPSRSRDSSSRNVMSKVQ